MGGAVVRPAAPLLVALGVPTPCITPISLQELRKLEIVYIKISRLTRGLTDIQISLY